ncbi:MAG: DUF4328 domain-containing protein [Pyrinomonadaceae bacterium]
MRSYVPTRNRARIFTIFISIFLASRLLGFILSLIFYASPDLALTASDPNSAFALFSLLLQSTAFLSYICTIIFFLMWLYSSYANLSAFGIEGLNSSPGWAVGSWFIPFYNLFKPLGVVSEVWNNSEEAAVEENEGFFVSYSNTGAPPKLITWWVFWLLAIFASNFVPTERQAETLDYEAHVFLVFLIGIVTFFFIVSGLLLINIVRTITTRQELQAIATKNQMLDAVPEPPTF